VITAVAARRFPRAERGQHSGQLRFRDSAREGGSAMLRTVITVLVIIILVVVLLRLV
jgi:hypothetical protein